MHLIEIGEEALLGELDPRLERVPQRIERDGLVATTCMLREAVHNGANCKACSVEAPAPARTFFLFV